MIFAATAVVFVLLYLGPYRNPGWIRRRVSPPPLLLFGVAAFTTGEFIREAVRKPYIIYNVVLGNQILPGEVAGLRQNGFLQGGVWTRACVKDYLKQLKQRHPELLIYRPATASSRGLLRCRKRSRPPSAR